MIINKINRIEIKDEHEKLVPGILAVCIYFFSQISPLHHMENKDRLLFVLENMDLIATFPENDHYGFTT